MKFFIILLAGLLPTYIVRFSLLGIPTNFFEISVWIVAFSTVLSRIAQKQAGKISGGKTLGVNAETPSVEEPVIFTFIALFLLSAVISTIISPNIWHSLGILKGWVITPIIFGLLIRGSRVPARDNTTHQIMRSLIMSGLVVALLGISQIDGFNRITSIYDVPNSLALFLVPVFFIAVWIGMQQKNRLYQFASLVMLIAIIWTQSFGAILAIVGTMVVTVIPGLTRDPRRPGFRLPGRNDNFLFPLLLAIISVILLFTLSGRIQYLVSPLIHPNATNSATVRLQLWDIGILLIQKHPLLGIGLGQFEHVYQAELHSLFVAQEKGLQPTCYNLPSKWQPEFVFRDPHNWIISFWLNVGLLGLISFICLNYIAIRRAISPSRMRASQPLKAVGGGFVSERVYKQAVVFALVSMLIFGLVDTIYWKNDLSALWWMLVIFLI